MAIGRELEERGTVIDCMRGGHVCRLAQDGHPLSGMSFGVAGIITALVNLCLDKGWLRTVPTPGRILAAMSEGLVGAEEYNRAWANCAAKTMW